jgi:hypothetical protein
MAQAVTRSWHSVVRQGSCGTVGKRGQFKEEKGNRGERVELGWPRKLGLILFEIEGNLGCTMGYLGDRRNYFPIFLVSVEMNSIRIQMISNRIRKLKH